MVILCTVFAIAALRTNFVLFLILLILIPCFSCVAAAFFQLGNGNVALGTKLQHVGAGLLLVASLLGWYLFAGLVLLGVDFPIGLPLGDLSTVIKGASERKSKVSSMDNA
jgi:hypothetical protein